MTRLQLRFIQPREVELFVNGESQGRKTMSDNARATLYNVNFNPGTIEVVGYNNGTEASRCSSRTASEPDNIFIEKVGGRAGTGFDDVEILSVQIVDKDGIICPNNDCKIELKVEGAELIAIDNADVLAHETCHKSAVFNTYQGSMTAYIRRTSTTGKVTVTATDCSSAAALKGSATF
jgi:beta-galactosidase